jgi:hypothetical protein
MLVLDVISEITLATYYLYHQQEILSHYGLSPEITVNHFSDFKKEKWTVEFFPAQKYK